MSQEAVVKPANTSRPRNDMDTRHFGIPRPVSPPRAGVAASVDHSPPQPRVSRGSIYIFCRGRLNRALHKLFKRATFITPENIFLALALKNTFLAFAPMNTFLLPRLRCTAERRNEGGGEHLEDGNWCEHPENILRCDIRYKNKHVYVHVYIYIYI